MFQWEKSCKLLLGNGVPAMAGHLTLEERDRIAQLRHQQVDQNEIAQALGRCPSTISRELRRNGTGSEYYDAQLQREAERRRRKRSTPGSSTTRTATTGSRCCGVAANAGGARKTPIRRLRPRAFAIARRSSKSGGGWGTSKATPCSARRAPGAWQLSCAASRG